VPVDDRRAPTDHQLAAINQWISESDVEQPVVYVHCQGGLGRSPTLATALLMQRGFNRSEAHRFILAGRPAASPTPDQDAWLAVIESELQRLSG
jgi:protein-tyrosine phosphatase